jgi:hypothetical protein
MFMLADLLNKNETVHSSSLLNMMKIFVIKNKTSILKLTLEFRASLIINYKVNIFFEIFINIIF